MIQFIFMIQFMFLSLLGFSDSNLIRCKVLHGSALGCHTHSLNTVGAPCVRLSSAEHLCSNDETDKY